MARRNRRLRVGTAADAERLILRSIETGEGAVILSGLDAMASDPPAEGDRKGAA